MLVTIDPDVITLALNANNRHKQLCEDTIEYILSDQSSQIALDRDGILFKEYIRLFENYLEDENSFVVQFLELFIDPGLNADRVQNLRDAYIDRDIEYMLQRREYAPVEPTMIRMGANTSRKFVIFLAPPPGLRRRHLYDQNIAQAFMRQMKKGEERVQIAHAGQREIKFPALQIETKTQYGLWFENKVQPILQKILGCEELYQKTPKHIEDEVGDVDFFGYTRQGNSCKIWIGECKLFEAIENGYVPREKIKQLKRKTEIIRSYELAKSGIDDVEITCCVISNGIDLAPDAWELANEIKAVFFQTVLTKEWRQKGGHWGIETVRKCRGEKINGQWNCQVEDEIPCKYTVVL